MSFSSRVLTLSLAAVSLGSIAGCDKLENEKKAPLVVGDPSFLSGEHMQHELNLTDQTARSMLVNMGDGNKGSLLDWYQANENGDYIGIDREELRGTDAGYFTTKRSTDIKYFGHEDSEAYFTVNLTKSAIGIGTIRTDIEGLIDEFDAEEEGEPLPLPDLADTAFHCVNYDVRYPGLEDSLRNNVPSTVATTEIRTSELSFDDSGRLHINETDGGTPFTRTATYTFGDRRQLLLDWEATATESAPDETLKEEVTNADGGPTWLERQVSQYCPTAEVNVWEDRDAEDNVTGITVVEDVRDANSTRRRIVCDAEVASYGNLSGDGQFFNYSLQALVHQKVNPELGDQLFTQENCKPSADDPDVEECDDPTVPRTDLKIKLVHSGKHILGRWGFCIRKSDRFVDYDTLAGNYWWVSYQTNDPNPEMRVSEVSINDEGLAIIRDKFTSETFSKEEKSLTIRPSLDGELWLPSTNRYGAVADNGSFFFLDMTNSLQDGFAFAVRKEVVEQE